MVWGSHSKVDLFLYLTVKMYNIGPSLAECVQLIPPSLSFPTSPHPLPLFLRIQPNAHILIFN